MSDSKEFNESDQEVSSHGDSIENACCICLGDIDNKTTTDVCPHSFCFSCIKRWSEERVTCPMCRQEFSELRHDFRGDGTYSSINFRNPVQENDDDSDFDIIDDDSDFEVIDDDSDLDIIDGGFEREQAAMNPGTGSRSRVNQPGLAHQNRVPIVINGDDSDFDVIEDDSDFDM